MKNRLLKKIREARYKRRKLFSAFLTLGYPNLQTTEKLIVGFAERGVDMVELGFPFSDPLADGPTIQYSSEQALRRGVRPEDAFRLVRRLRQRGVEIPLIFFSYLNPIFHLGESAFPRHLKAAGFDGLIVPDCPPEEDRPLWKACRHQGISPIFLIAPTTSPSRARKIFAGSEGFVYYVSLRGVTGARQSLARDLKANLKALKRLGRKPILVGFGVSSPGQVRKIGRMGDGVIVGSALVDAIRHSRGNIHKVFSFVESLMRPLRNEARR